MKLHVCIPVKNRLDLTRSLVGELQRQGGFDRLSVYDNGSEDGTMDWLRAQPAVTAVEATGMTLHEMWNDAVSCVPTDQGHALAILNNDLVLDGRDDWLERLCAPLSGRWRAISPNYDDRSGSGVVRVSGIAAGLENGAGGLAGFAFAVRGDVFSWYRFPEDMGWWCGDSDLVCSLDMREYPYGINLDVGVEHVGGGSQTARDYDMSNQIKRDRALLRAKWQEFFTIA